MRKSHAIFLINLLQDVNIVRPLVLLAAQNLHVSILIMVTYKFLQRDANRVWQQELAKLCAETNASVQIYSNESEALACLQGKYGVLIAASESNLSAHKETHNVFRIAPPGFLRITLQHGFECIGFLQNREHDRAHGTAITFAADIICGWFPADKMASMTPSQRPKLYVSGPPAVLQIPEHARSKKRGALVCENLHSVRLRASGDFTTSFLDTFNAFCNEEALADHTISLRPHPGGQYTIKNQVELPGNVRLENLPIYSTDLTQFDFGISAPSSIIIDMILAKIPVGIWHDAAGIMDTANYIGLTHISTLEDWVNFSKSARQSPEIILERQETFLNEWHMPFNPDDVKRRFLNVMSESYNLPIRVKTKKHIRRILIIANGNIPTVQICFTKPLNTLIESGNIVAELYTEEHMKDLDGVVRPELGVRFLYDFAPDIVVFCRYSGPGYEDFITAAHDLSCATVYHIDDDLLNIPIQLGEAKHAWHNNPARLTSVRFLLEHVDLVYASTEPLKKYLETLDLASPVVVGDVHCAGSVLRQPGKHPLRKIGYMGFDHAHDLEMVLPALVTFLRNNPDVRFELFGSIPKPVALDEFGDRITKIKPLGDYSAFLNIFAQLGWDIGICPLQEHSFNRLKANNKWVEYTSVGCAVIATGGMMYDDCCAGGSGILANSEAEWLNAFNLLADTDIRVQMIENAQLKLKKEYSEDQLRLQMLSFFFQAEGLKQRKSPVTQKERILVVTDSTSATQDIHFRRPLGQAVKDGLLTLEIVGADKDNLQIEAVCEDIWKRIRPTVLIASRYGQVIETPFYRLAKADNVPIIFHIDDNLLTVPIQLGKAKYKLYNRPERKASLRAAMMQSDTIYTSTDTLSKQLRDEGIDNHFFAGAISSSVDPADIVRATPSTTPVIGYMGTAGHLSDLEMVMPVVHRLMAEIPDLRFELFGSIISKIDLSQYGERFVAHETAPTYEAFLSKLATLGWWAGLAPLETTDFNMCKSYTKWVEYSLAAIPAVASDVSVYREVCANGAGMLAANHEEWYKCLSTLIADSDSRNNLVSKAQQKLCNNYAHDKMTAQVLRAIREARINLAN